MDQPVVAARPDRAALVLGLDHVVDRPVDLASGALSRDRAAAVALLVVLVARQVRADLLPRHAAVPRAHEVVRRVVDRAVVVWRRHDGRVPIVPVFHFAALKGRRHHRIYADVPRTGGLVVILADDAHVTSGINEAWVVGIEGRVGALTPAHRVPVLPRDAAVAHARDCDRAVVLLAAVYEVGEAVVHVDAVELRRRLIPLCGPGVSAVEGDVRPAVVGVDHRLAVIRVDPQIVCISVRHTHHGEVPAPVDRPHHGGVEHVDRLFIQRIGEDLDVVPGACARRPVVADELPGLASVVRAEDPAARIGLDDREDPVGVRP